MRKILILLFFLISLGFVPGVFAQLQSESNEVRTRVGNPTIQASSCPIPGGVPSCGSRNEPRGGCGHCSAAYTAAYGCNYESLAYAIDIPAPYGTDVILPLINERVVRWSFLDQYNNNARTAIQRYGGTDEETGEQYLIKFHHSAPGSGGGTKFSGDVGARICDAPCSVGTGPHVHVEFARVNSSGTYQWLDAPLYFCGG